MKKYLLLAGFAFIWNNQANAEIKPYVGMDLGASRIEYANAISEDGHTDTFMVADINVGAKFNDYFGLEISSQGSSEVDIDYLGKLSYSNIGLDAVGYIPLNTKLELFAMAGVGYYNFDLELDEKLEGLDVHLTDDKVAFRGGLGMQYNIDDKWSIRGLFRYHHIDSDYFDYIGEASFGVRYNFQ